MDIQSCLIRLGYKTVVWGNSYEGIKPHELENRPIPSLAELEAVWPIIEAERIAAEKTEKEEAEKESLIQAKMREQAITALKVEGKLTLDGKIAGVVSKDQKGLNEGGI
jgi:hypothetical protein